jgi:hypothetical protein
VEDEMSIVKMQRDNHLVNLLDCDIEKHAMLITLFAQET